MCSIALLILGASESAAAGQKHLALRMSEQEWFDHVRVVAVERPRFTGAFQSDDTLQAIADSVWRQLDTLLVNALHETGTEVVHATVFDSLLMARIDSIGGLYDPYTGALDTVRDSIVTAITRAQLREKYHVDAIAASDIVFRWVWFREGSAEWDGVREAATQSDFGAVFKEVLLKGRSNKNRDGQVRALTLSVRCESMSGNVLYESAGGLHLITHLTGARFVELPLSQYLHDHGRMERAVKLAFSDLTQAARRRNEQKGGGR